MGFPKYTGPGTVESFTQSLVEESGVFLLPSTIYKTDLGESIPDRFRLGYGRRGLDEGLTAMAAHMHATS